MSDSILTPLNPAQQEIVQHLQGPALVIAGAGSGKTRVITHRVGHLLRHGVPASSILLLTFTNKAAQEMATRVAQLTGSAHEKGPRLLHGTFHSMASRFLRRYAQNAGYEQNFSILDSSDAQDLLKAALAEVMGKTSKHFPNAAVLSNVFSNAFNANCSVELLAERPYAERDFQLEDYVLRSSYAYLEPHLEPMGQILRKYREKKRRNQVLDFDDLLEGWLDLLRTRYDQLPLCQQIQQVLVDEYQDTNRIQAQILDFVSRPHRNLMVVGDDAQSIYSWRGANFRNILDFPEQYGAATYRLEQNYRSTPQILEVANASINQNVEQFEKHLFTELAEGAPPQIHHVWDSYAEADFLLEAILHLRDQDVALNDMCVLYRTHAQAAVLQVALTRAGIPFQIHSGVKFFEQAHIKDLLSFLKVLFNPLDEISWMRVLKMLNGIGNVTAQKIYNVFQAQQAVRLTAANEELQRLVPAKARDDWARLLECFQKMLEPDVKPNQMLEIVYQRLYRDILLNTFDNAPQREADVHSLQEYAAGYASLEAFLNELSLLGNAMVTDQAAREWEEQETLTLTTIHQAKGLEWEAVFLIGLTEGLFPHQRSLDRAEQIEEERRLFYVALTRAKRHLCVTAPAIASSYQGPSHNGRSRFLEELPDDLVERVVHEPSYSSGGGRSPHARFEF
jgi:DNA helicase-2/ATP-dependent DNA helicase PcrA